MKQVSGGLRRRISYPMVGMLVAVGLTVVALPSRASALTCGADQHSVWIDFNKDGLDPIEEYRCINREVEFESAETFGDFLQTEGFNADHADILRLYEAFFDRDADLDGAKYWLRTYEQLRQVDPNPVLLIAQSFVVSNEFNRAHTGVSDDEFVSWAYGHVLGRVPDQEGSEYWMLAFSSGQLTRGAVVYWIAQSGEFESDHLYVPSWQRHLIYSSAPSDWIPQGI